MMIRLKSNEPPPLVGGVAPRAAPRAPGAPLAAGAGGPVFAAVAAAAVFAGVLLAGGAAPFAGAASVFGLSFHQG